MASPAEMARRYGPETPVPEWQPDNPLAVKVAARNIPLYRDPAVMLIDQLKEISIAGELDIVETANWNPKVTRRDYMVGLENNG